MKIIYKGIQNPDVYKTEIYFSDLSTGIYYVTFQVKDVKITKEIFCIK